ncbi:hypothetical protein N9L76_06995 [bacterium]|nr:hypothetical protein [bacterium]
MTAGALLRAAGRSFASNKSTGLAVAVQQVRLFRGQHSRGSRIGKRRAEREIFFHQTPIALPDSPFFVHRAWNAHARRPCYYRSLRSR